MFNVECCKLYGRRSLKLFRGMLLNGDPGVFVFCWGRLPEKGAQFFLGVGDHYRNYGVVVIWLSFDCKCDNLILKLHQEKRSHPDEEWRFIDRFKAGSVPGMNIALVASKKSIKTHLEYDARPLIKAINCY